MIQLQTHAITTAPPTGTLEASSPRQTRNGAFLEVSRTQKVMSNRELFPPNWQRNVESKGNKFGWQRLFLGKVSYSIINVREFHLRICTFVAFKWMSIYLLERLAVAHACSSTYSHMIIILIDMQGKTAKPRRYKTCTIYYAYEDVYRKGIHISIITLKDWPVHAF